MVRKQNDIEMNSMHNEEKIFVAEDVLEKLKNKIYNYMT